MAPPKLVKKKFAIAIGYKGTNYHGMQKQCDGKGGDNSEGEDNDGPVECDTIEGAVEKALFRAGGIEAFNMGDLSKVQWTRAARTDKGVHAACQLVALRLSLPLSEEPLVNNLLLETAIPSSSGNSIGTDVGTTVGATDGATDGTTTPIECVASATSDLESVLQSFKKRFNEELPPDVRCYGLYRVTKSFNARRYCSRRLYKYLLPLSALEHVHVAPAYWPLYSYYFQAAEDCTSDISNTGSKDSSASASSSSALNVPRKRPGWPSESHGKRLRSAQAMSSTSLNGLTEESACDKPNGYAKGNASVSANQIAAFNCSSEDTHGGIDGVKISANGKDTATISGSGSSVIGATDAIADRSAQSHDRESANGREDCSDVGETPEQSITAETCGAIFTANTTLVHAEKPSSTDAKTGLGSESGSPDIRIDIKSVVSDSDITALYSARIPAGKALGVALARTDTQALPPVLAASDSRASAGTTDTCTNTAAPDIPTSGFYCSNTHDTSSNVSADPTKNCTPSCASSASEDLVNRMNAILSQFVGFHRFHNFTSGAASRGNTGRFIHSFKCHVVTDPGGCPMLSLEVEGQSFMLYQIRKLIGLAIEVFRGSAPPESISYCLHTKNKMHVPMAPAEGLYLHHPIYDSYNESKANPPLTPFLDYADVREEIECFERDYIYQEIWNCEQQGIWRRWLSDINWHPFFLENRLLQ